MQEDENGKLKQEDTYANLHARVLQSADGDFESRKRHTVDVRMYINTGASLTRPTTTALHCAVTDANTRATAKSLTTYALATHLPIIRVRLVGNPERAPTSAARARGPAR